MNPLKRNILSLFYAFRSYSNKRKWKGDQRIFCLSLQKTGTTSFGDFFVHLGYPVVRSDMAQLRGWNKFWFLGDYHKIFIDPVFKNNQVFEDAPFWGKDFYKVLHEKFPDAKFVLFTRNSNAWFQSLLRHGNGKILGDKRFHAKNYNMPAACQDSEFDLASHRNYYTHFYEERNNDIKNYFNGKSNFLHLELENPDKWNRLADFLGIQIPEDFDIHSNIKQ